MEDSRRTGAASVWISFFLDPRDHLLPTKNERKMRKKREAKKITTEATNENPAKQFTETRKKEKKRKEDRTSSVQNKQTNQPTNKENETRKEGTAEKKTTKKTYLQTWCSRYDDKSDLNSNHRAFQSAGRAVHEGEKRKDEEKKGTNTTEPEINHANIIMRNQVLKPLTHEPF